MELPHLSRGQAPLGGHPGRLGPACRDGAVGSVCMLAVPGSALSPPAPAASVVGTGWTGRRQLRLVGRSWGCGGPRSPGSPWAGWTSAGAGPPRVRAPGCRWLCLLRVAPSLWAAAPSSVGRRALAAPQLPTSLRTWFCNLLGFVFSLVAAVLCVSCSFPLGPQGHSLAVPRVGAVLVTSAARTSCPQGHPRQGVQTPGSVRWCRRPQVLVLGASSLRAQPRSGHRGSRWRVSDLSPQTRHELFLP